MPRLDASLTDDFEQYRHDVYAWAYRLLGRHHDALDVARPKLRESPRPRRLP